jgi:hypothetical protein
MYMNLQSQGSHKTGRMSQQTAGKPLTFNSIQDIFSFGYLYLLILGIVGDSIYYGIVGVNIISYSNVLDVLLSPIVHLTSSLQFPIVIIGLPGLLYLYVLFLRRVLSRSEKHRSSFINRLPLGRAWAIITATAIFSAYMGYGLGGGFALKNALVEGKIQTNHRITFKSGEEVEAKLVGNNSAFIFYVIEGGTAVSISPLQDNVARIEKIKK